jgi:enediyne biosynthesis protein E4
VIDWRDGRRSTIRGVRPNREYEVRQAAAVPIPATPRAVPAPLFIDATAELGGHVHVEDAFDDWDRQFLLPNALSTLGPGVAWFDADRDGDEDLVVGAGKGGRITMFRNDNGRRYQTPVGAALTADATTVLGLASTDSRLLVGLSSWQARSIEELRASPAVAGAFVGGSGRGASEVVVPSQESAVGPMALSDYDGDGDLDLFVGGRAIPMQYPVDASSLLLRNTAGRFESDAANSRAL